MATNEPFVPSMIFRSRTTKALSNVTEQKACNRSLFSSTSLMRTSVMTTAILLLTCGNSDATSDREDAQRFPRRRLGAQQPSRPHRLAAVPTHRQHAGAAARHQAAGGPQPRHPPGQVRDGWTEVLGRPLQAVEQEP